MTRNNSIERRRSQRVPYTLEISYKDRNKDNQGFKHAYGKDLSEHGLLFETYESFPPCTILEIRLELPVISSDMNSAKKNGIYVPKTDMALNEGQSSFSSKNPYKSLSPVSQEIELSNSSRSFHVLAEVVRIEEVKRPWLYNIGVSFCKVDNECRQIIKEFAEIHGRNMFNQQITNTVFK